MSHFEERVDDIPCPWCEATISVPVSIETRSRERLCWSCRMPIKVTEKGPGRGANKTVRLDRCEPEAEGQEVRL